MTVLSEACQFSRQNLYQTYLHCDVKKLERQDELKREINHILDEHSGWSGIKVWQELQARGFKVGRDKFYKLVNADQLTKNSQRKAWRRSHPRLKPRRNLIANRRFSRVFEVLFSDYTEILTAEGKLQLLLQEDLVSRYITAYRISNSCSAAPVVEALQESLALKASLRLRYPTIFHTDCGSEFVNHAVGELAAKYNLLLSNTGKHRCFENPFMESLNRTLKYSLGLRVKFATKEEAGIYIESAIRKYNHEHRHSRLGKRIPYSVLIGYTGKNHGSPGGNRASCPPPGRRARSYSKSLIVKVNKIGLDK